MKKEGYKNEWFVRNLVNASGKTTLAEAAPEWEFLKFGRTDTAEKNKKYGQCQLCHSRLIKYVAIKNERNSVILLIGEDCYDKLLRYLDTQELQGINLQDRKKYIAKIKQYCKREINEAFLEWFKGVENLSAEIQNTLAVIDALGYAPSLTAAQEIVEYYKTHRKFALGDLLTYVENKELKDLFEYFPEHQQKITETVTLSEFERIREEINILKNEMEKEIEQRKKEIEQQRQKLIRRIKKGESIQMQNATLYNDSGNFTPGKGYVSLPKLELSFTSDGIRFVVILPREEIKECLGKNRFTKKVEKSLEDTMPAQARFNVEAEYEEIVYLKMKDKDILMWLQLPGTDLLEARKRLEHRKLEKERKRQKKIRERDEEVRRHNDRLHFILEHEIMAEKEMDKLYAKSPSITGLMKMKFRLNVHPKSGRLVWEHKDENRVKYVLDWRCQYSEVLNEGEIYVRIVRSLALDVILVERIVPHVIILDRDSQWNIRWAPDYLCISD